MGTAVLSREEYFKAIEKWQKDYHKNYLAMYSSQWGGIVTDPALWTLPVDDHAVHRGDAVFEVFKCLGGRAYCLDDHLGKLAKTANYLAIKMPPEFTSIREILADLLKAGGQKDCLVRMTVTRGPGGFTSNPYESPLGLLIITVLTLPRYSDEKYEKGVKAITSPLLAKDPSIATMKLTSYIQNVLLKKAALDAGAEYGICFNRDGFMTESSTENISIVTAEGEFLAPKWNIILKGTTLTRLMEIAKSMVKEGLLKDARHEDISQTMLLKASEVIISSTTTDALPITELDGKKIGTGSRGLEAKEFLKRLKAEYSEANSNYLSDLWMK